MQFVLSWEHSHGYSVVGSHKESQTESCTAKTEKRNHTNTLQVAGRKCTQRLGASPTKQCRYISRILLVTSVWPSDWGWYALLKASFVPCSWNNSLQKWWQRPCLDHWWWFWEDHEGNISQPRKWVPTTRPRSEWARRWSEHILKSDQQLLKSRFSLE